MLAFSPVPPPNFPTCPLQGATASRTPKSLTIHVEKSAAGVSKPWVLKQPGTAYSRRRNERIAHVFQQDADVVPETNDEWDDEDDRAVPSATKIVVVGAGPIGLLTASYFARRGYNVEVFERRPHPAVRTAPTAPDHPVMLSSRALLAFKELGMQTSFAAPGANPHKGTFDMASGGLLAPANPGHPYRGTVVTSKRRLEAEILQEMRRKYPTLIKITYGAELVTADFDARKAIVTMQEGSQGSSLHVQGCRSRGPGNVLLAAATRPSGDPAAAVEELVPYDLLIGADGADSIVRERMVQAKVRQLHTQRPMRELEQFAEVSLPLQQHASTAGSAAAVEDNHTQIASPSAGNDSMSTSGEALAPTSSSGDGTEASSSSQADDASSSSISSSSSSSPALQPQIQLPVDIQGHDVGEYLYEWRRQGVPTVQLWMSEPGKLSGVVQGILSWDAASLSSALSAAYSTTLPKQWLDMIVQQASSAAAAGRLGRYSATVQSTQYHGPRVLLVGDAAHAMTGDLRQGLNCAIEGVRMLNIVVRASQDNLDKVPMTMSQVRGEDAQCMQQLEAFQRSLRGDVAFGDPLFRVASALGSLIWRSALLVVAGLRKIWPSRFPEDYVQQQVMDARMGYNEILKIMVRFAVVPIIALLGVVAAAFRVAAANGKIAM